MYLSKSLYIRGLQCTKSLWLKVNNPTVLTTVDNKSQTRFEDGQKVGLLARQIFPGGREIPLTTADDQIQKTEEYIDSGIKHIYEATFEYDNVMIMIDILKINDDGSLEIYEVKSSTKPKKVHFDDISIQYYVLKGLGYLIKSCNLIYLNKHYYREESLDLDQLFIINEVSDPVLELQSDIPEHLNRLQRVLNNGLEDVPIGSHCMKPYECDAKSHCWEDNSTDSIFSITGLSMDAKMDLYSRGIRRFDQITDFNDLNSSQKIQIKSELNQEGIIDKGAVTKFLHGLSYPVYHLDFESFQHALPEWPGVNPYMHIPFQYSLHIEGEDGQLEHREFLAREGTDPRYELVQQLIYDIPPDVTVLAYNKSFEKGIIKKLALFFPRYEEHLLSISRNVQDLMIPFKNREYYLPGMKGSYSIKNVLPALVPEMADAYKELDGVHNGTEAMTVFPKLTGMNEDDKKKYRNALLKYCELDTYAMVRILDVLRRVGISEE